MPGLKLEQVGDGAIARSRGAAASYDATAKWLHWSIVLLMIAQYIIAILMPDIGPKTQPGTLINLHFSIGVVILLVIIIRFIHRQIHPVPLDMPDAPEWERWTAEATHRLFYFILIVSPFLGWASASAHQLPVNVFGVLPLPDLAAPHAQWALVAGDIHKLSMWVLLALIGLHAAAALYHHFVRHDGVLLRMLPGRR